MNAIISRNTAFSGLGPADGEKEKSKKPFYFYARPQSHAICKRVPIQGELNLEITVVSDLVPERRIQDYKRENALICFEERCPCCADKHAARPSTNYARRNMCVDELALRESGPRDSTRNDLRCGYKKLKSACTTERRDLQTGATLEASYRRAAECSKNANYFSDISFE